MNLMDNELLTGVVVPYSGVLNNWDVSFAIRVSRGLYRHGPVYSTTALFPTIREAVKFAADNGFHHVEVPFVASYRP